MDIVNEFLQKTRLIAKYDFGGHTNEYMNVRPRIECTDGFNLSVQASDTCYCEPRGIHGPYSKVEVGFPSELEELLMPYVEDENNPTSTVYGWVPVDIVAKAIDKHGGIANMPE